MNSFFNRLDSRYVKVCAYASATVLLTMAALMVLYSASPVIATLWDLICAVLEPLVYGAALSYVLNPLVKRVSHRLRRRPRYANNGTKRRNAAVTISLILVLLVLLGIVTVLLLMITHSLASLKWTNIQAIFADASGDFLEYIAVAEERLEQWGLISKDSDNNLITIFNGAKNAASTALFAIIFGVYLLIDGPRVSNYLARVMRAVLGKHAIDPSRMIADADRVFSGYFRGQGIDALVVGTLSGIVLTAIGVPYGPVIGLLTGLGNLIPYIGGPVGFGSIALMCLAEGSWLTMALGFAAMGLVMVVDGNIINPRLLSDNVEVHPMLVIAALIAGGGVGGIAGMLVAVPTAAFLKIQLDRWLEKRERSSEGEVTTDVDATPGE
jgi:predicted PurR-regulated permease PerM